MAGNEDNNRAKEKQSSNRSDPAWKYGEQIDVPTAGKNYVYLKCKFCGKKITGGVKRLKDHLGKTHKNVSACSKAPKEVEEEMKGYLGLLCEKKKLAAERFENICKIGSYMDDDDIISTPATEHNSIDIGTITKQQIRGPMDGFILASESASKTHEKSAQQSTLNAYWKKEERNRVCLSIGRFFFENGLAFNIANSPSFRRMLEHVGQFGRGLKPPSMYELRTWILQEDAKTISGLLEEFKESCKLTGCTVMTDGWTYTSQRTLINFLVNNPKGTWFLKSVDATVECKDADMLFHLIDGVIEEIGEENIVQVVTDNASNYKAVGQRLMEKRKMLYWTPCAAHCLDLILEDIFELPLFAAIFKKAKKLINFIYAHTWLKALMKKKLGKELLKPAITRFATAFLTLTSIIGSKEGLQEMFACRLFTQSIYVKKPAGKVVKHIILTDKHFWRGVAYIVMTTKPLVNVLRMVDGEKYPPMGFIYEAMDRAKEKIAEAVDGKIEKYEPIWQIIDRRWACQLHQHLHAAAYFRNPQLQYEPTFSNHPEVKLGLYSCIDRMIKEEDDKLKANLQLDPFVNAQGLFGDRMAIKSRRLRTPVDWWLAYGDETPELKKFAVRVLSLTCSSSGCERNWSAFNQVHTKRRNRLSQQRLNDLVYVMFNLKLKERAARKKTMGNPLYLNVNDIDSDDEWLTELQNEGDDLDIYNPPIDEDDDLGDSGMETTKKSKKRKAIEGSSGSKGKEIAEEEEEACSDDGSDEGTNQDDEQIKYMDNSIDDITSSDDEAKYRDLYDFY